MVDVPSKRFVFKWRRVSDRRQLPDIIAFRKLQKHPNPLLAAKQLREYTAKWPYDALAHYSLGVLILNEEKKPASAIKSFKTAISLKPELGNVYVDLTLAHLAMNSKKHDEDALFTSEKAIKLMPHAGESWNVRGAVLGKSLRIYEAIRAYKKSLFYDKNQPMLHRNLGKMFVSLILHLHNVCVRRGAICQSKNQILSCIILSLILQPITNQYILILNFSVSIQ